MPLRHLAPSQALASLVDTTKAFEAAGSAAVTADSFEAFGITADTADAFEAGSDAAAGATRRLYCRFARLFVLHVFICRSLFALVIGVCIWRVPRLFHWRA